MLGVSRWHQIPDEQHWGATESHTDASIPACQACKSALSLPLTLFQSLSRCKVFLILILFFWLLAQTFFCLFASLTELSSRFRAMWQIPTQSHASGAGDCRLNSRWSVVAPGCPALSGNQCLWARLPMVTRTSTRKQAVEKICWCVLDLYNFNVTPVFPQNRRQNCKIWAAVDVYIFGCSAILQLACKG